MSAAEGRLGPLRVRVLGLEFTNPVMLAAGTCGFGRELAEVLDLEALGGFVCKSVTLERREGNPAPRVAETATGMLNSVGLANPGAHQVRDEYLPWLRRHVSRPRVFMSVAGHAPEEYLAVVEILEEGEGFHGFELNLSCPNDTRLGGRPFAFDPDALQEVVSGVRERTDRPLLVKLAPNDPDLEATAAAAEESGADGLTLVNTLPGLQLDPRTGRPALGAGAGGMSGPALLPVGVGAVRRVRRATGLPLVGVGGIATAADALQYLRAGAALVQIGTASFADPRTAERVIQRLARGSWTGDRDGDEAAPRGRGDDRAGTGRKGAPGRRTPEEGTAGEAAPQAGEEAPTRLREGKAHG